MKKLIKLTETDLRNIVENTVYKLLNEEHFLELPQKEQPMPMDMPPMGADPMMGDPNAMGEDPNMDDSNDDPQMEEDPMGEENLEEPSMDEDGDNDEILNLWNKLDTKKKATLLKYGQSMCDEDNDGIVDSQDTDIDPNGEGEDPNAMGDAPQPMQESRVTEILNSFDKRLGKRGDKKNVNAEVSYFNPFRSSRN